jgi:hypothetical protein
MTTKFAGLLLQLMIAAAAALAQEGAGRGAPTTGAVGRGAGPGGLPVQPPLGVTPKSAIPNAKPVRSCESLASVTLPNTTIESASADPLNPGICRVTAITTHPPEGDKVRIWIAIPTENWNGRFLGIGGGGFTGGNAAGVNQPVALGYAAGSTDTGTKVAAAALRWTRAAGWTGSSSGITRTLGFTK